ncbi:inositol monophosphatase family protein [Streptomyces sp. CSDS2]|uniref:inositol monophosphatase family protein n=1 Tax=Streptomyces sp. CSDS2 TaxID=3055051 RepID=UPI0025B1903E|nr:inositol monophosphatase family protein [Streptomyces sp. CSDS2]MDN3260821.1 inositol monophosphatase family protein [Streptomyces sp. CSDS2]
MTSTPETTSLATVLGGVLDQASGDMASLRSRGLDSATGLRGRLQDLLTTALEEAWPDVPVLTATHRPPPSGALPDDCVLLNPLDGVAALAAGSAHFAVTACRIRRGFPVQGIVDLPAHHIRVNIEGAARTVTGHVDRLPLFGEDTVLTRPDDAGAARRILAGRPVETVLTASVMLTLVALGRARAAAHLPAGHDRATPWDYVSAALAVHTSGGTVRAPDGRDLAHSRRPAAHAGWLATNQPPRPAELAPLMLPPQHPTECHP